MSAALAGILLAWAVLACGAAEVAAPPKGEVVREGNLFVLLKPNYRVETDISPEAAQVIGAHMEAVHAAYRAILGGLGRVAVPPFRVRVYRERRDYLEVVGEGLARTIGLYVPEMRLLLACIGSDDLGRILGVLRHEGWHQFSHAVFGNLPPWVDEGLAEYFHHARVHRGRLVQGELPARELRFVQRAVAQRLALPLAELLALDHEAWTELRERDARRGSLAYCQAALLVHCLLDGEGGRYRQGFYQYLAQLYRRATPGEAMRQILGGDLARLQRVWERYLAAARPSPRYLCRENLSLIGQVLLNYGGGRKFTAEELRAALLAQALGRWEIGQEENRPIRSDRRDEILSLFRCPEDTAAPEAVSYEFSYAADAKLPKIRCTHHADYTIWLWYTYDVRGNRWVEHIAEEEEGAAR